MPVAALRTAVEKPPARLLRALTQARVRIRTGAYSLVLHSIQDIGVLAGRLNRMRPDANQRIDRQRMQPNFYMHQR